MNVLIKKNSVEFLSTRLHAKSIGLHFKIFSTVILVTLEYSVSTNTIIFNIEWTIKTLSLIMLVDFYFASFHVDNSWKCTAVAFTLSHIVCATETFGRPRCSVVCQSNLHWICFCCTMTIRQIKSQKSVLAFSTIEWKGNT